MADGGKQETTSDGHSRLTVWTLAGAAVAIGVLLHLVAPDLPAAQRATVNSFRLLARKKHLYLGLCIDVVFIISYLSLGWALFRLVRPESSEHSDGRSIAAAGRALLLVAGVADLVENVLLCWAVAHRSGEVGSVLGAMRAAGVVKWSLLAAAVLAMLLLLLTCPRAGYQVFEPNHRPSCKAGTPHPWDPPGAGQPSRLGICLSGGGIRSAAFALGGLQALQDANKLEKAEYLAAASGGGYLAAGWAVSNAQPGVGNPPVWSRGSPEERWFRNHSSYLIPDLPKGLRGVGRLLAGVVVNFIIVWLLLFLVARPVGWVSAAVHPELKAVEPVALPRDTEAAMAIGTIGPAQPATAVADGAAVPAQRFQVSVVPAPSPPEANEVCFDDKPFVPTERQPCFAVTQVAERHAVVEVRAGRAQVLVQPKVELEPQCLATEDSRRCKVYKLLEIAKQPKLALKDDAVDIAPRADQLKFTEQPTVRSKSGLRHRPDPTYRPWMWQGSLGLLATGAVAGFVVMAGRLRRGRAEIGRYIAIALALAGLMLLLITIALPALATWLPTLAVNLPGIDTGLADSLLPTGGLLAVSVAAARQYLLGSKKGAGTGAAKPSGGSGSFLGGIRKRLKGSEEQLTWYESSPTKILLYLLLVAGFVVSFVAQLQYSMANGFTGRLLGLAFVRNRMPDLLFLPEWVRFGIVAIGMGVFAGTVDAHAWSLFPFYKRRLSSAYILRRAGAKVERIPYEELLPFTPLAPNEVKWPGLANSQTESPPPGPKLVLCCAVNLSEPGIVPPARRAGSFTFGADYIGGPLVGYVDASKYWYYLPPSRRRDITIPSAMAISGAAFSPAMGKTNLGPVGSVLALANLRLGVWLPHPQRVNGVNKHRWGRWKRPGWPWFIREVMNKYRFQRRYLYVSDGGHWDNLGLVELLRRGCTEIICISAAGDGATSFGTIAEAIALARDELGVDITLDPTPLRPPVKAGKPTGRPGVAGAAPKPPPPPPPLRELRRTGTKDTESNYATCSSVTGTYTWRTPDVSGTITYIETALTDNLPFDVHGFAESEAIFPDDATGDQVFNHRQFEAFRALGYYQVNAAVGPA